jgi:methionyl-tRNA formyltransferase
MKILLLSSVDKCQNFIDFLVACGDNVSYTERKIDISSELLKEVDFIISYGYRHIIKADVLEIFQNRAINIHVSLLPWNRGADPNLWSFLENTPKGVTIHIMDKGIDTGDILIQEEIDFSCLHESETLNTTYIKLAQLAEDLFKRFWTNTKQNGMVLNPCPQKSLGTFHFLKDRAKYEYLLEKGWDTPVVKIAGKGVPIDKQFQVFNQQ